MSLPIIFGIIAIIINSKSDINFYRYGAFAQLSTAFLKNRLNTSVGIRSDMNSFTKDGYNPIKTLSPRASISYILAPKWTINIAAGKYYKIPPLTILGYRDNNNQLLNINAQYIGSQHFSAGFEYLPARATRITVEVFYKKYTNYPVSVRDSISLANLGGDFGVIGNEQIKSIGLGRTMGVEFFFQQC